jgi:hypothetical protein
VPSALRNHVRRREQVGRDANLRQPSGRELRVNGEVKRLSPSAVGDLVPCVHAKVL